MSNARDGFVGVAFVVVVGFFSSSQLPIGSSALNVGLVAAGAVIFTGLPLPIGTMTRASRRVAPPTVSSDVVPSDETGRPVKDGTRRRTSPGDRSPDL